MAQHSVLAQGQWYKIGVTQSGVYRITADFLQKTGLDLSAVNPKNLRLFGNGGRMLPQANAVARPTDLIENAILIEGEADGRFDSQDAIVFYGQSPHVIFYDSTAQRFRHEYNLYSDTTFYYLTWGTTAGLRISQRASVASGNAISIYDDYGFVEQDQKNMVQSGREWYGDDFGLLIADRDYSFDWSNVVSNTTVIVTSAVMAAAQGATEFQVKLNGQSVGKQSVSGISSDRYDYKGSENTSVFKTPYVTVANSALTVTLSYNRNGIASALGYLNYVGVEAKRTLRWGGKAFGFRSVESTAYATTTYQLSEVNEPITIWDITDPLKPLQQQNLLQSNQLTFGVTSTELRSFFAFSSKDYLEPTTIRAVANQDLRAVTNPNLIIITPPKFRAQAERLAAFRRTADKLSVVVASTEEVFNEFASGRPDPTALRDFVRYSYQSGTLKYLLLFGDAKFDPKNRTTAVAINHLADYVPVYESRESLSPLYSYSSDDYFGFLEANEGEWAESYAGDHTLEIGIGRLPVKTEQEAQIVVDKLIRYENEKSLGAWRNVVTFVADDGDGDLHQSDADNLAQYLNANQPKWLTNKVFLDAFPQLAGTTGELAPQVNKVVNQAVGNSLLVNYTGHGGESGWAQEQILTRADILGWSNYDKLSFFVTATCEFGRYDDPNLVSGAELALLNAKGGAVGLITTTRPVFANTNFLVNDAFYRAVFTPINGQMPRIGDVMRLTKNNSLSGRINRNFALLGDPSMQLAYPKQNVVLTKLNGKAITEKLDTLKALSKVTLEGEVRLPNTTTRNTAFNGTVFLTIFDKETTTTTLGNEGSKMTFKERKNVVIEGQVSLKNGAFTSTFTLPKDIIPALGKSKISFYAQATNGQDAAGVFENILIGSSSTLADNQPPVIKAFLDNEQFVNGSTISAKPTLIAKLSDDTGLNLSLNSMTATLDDTVTIVLNPYFQTTVDDFKAGEIQYSFKNVVEGNHRLVINVRDVNNNPAKATLDFTVAMEPNTRLRNVRCYPNPFKETTAFEFEHDFDGQDVEVTLDIYNAAGQRLRRLQLTDYRSVSPFTQLSWDGSNDSIQKIATGLYFYRIFARSIQTNTTASGGGKVMFSN